MCALSVVCVPGLGCEDFACAHVRGLVTGPARWNFARAHL